MSSPESKALLLKIEVLKKGLLDERKKRGELEEEIIKLKEEGVIKQENLDKLKKELLRLRDKNGKTQLGFLTNLFDKEGVDQTEHQNRKEEEELLRKQIEDLNKKLASYEEEQTFINTKLTDSIKENNSLKTQHQEEIKNINRDNEDKIKKMQEKYDTKIQELQKQIFAQNQTIAEQTKSINCMSELYKSFDIDKVNFEKKTKDLTQELDQTKTKVISLEAQLQDQAKLLSQIEKDKDAITQLQDEIRQYKIIIKDLTPLNVEHLFQGYVIPKEKGALRKKIELSFGKYKQSLYFKIEDEKERVLVQKEIADILLDKKSNNMVWICIYIQGKQTNYLCEFTIKEIEYIIRFYHGVIQGKTNNIDNALMNVSLGDYFY